MMNFLYNESMMLGSGYMCTKGLAEEFQRQGNLCYAYDTCGPTWLDEEQFCKYPIFYIRGWLQGRMPWVQAGKDQFKATLQSESFYTRHGKIDPSSVMIREREHLFGLIITFAESDSNTYKVPTVWMPSWGDTTVLDDVHKPIYDQLGFVGGMPGREDWYKQDKNKIILHKQTELSRSSIVNARRYTDMICNFSILVAPPGRCFNSMTGRTFEIMACKRLCLAYVNPDTMFKHMEFFKDGEDYVTWQTFQEMEEKYHYYMKHPEERDRIALNGYNKIRKYHNHELAASYIYDQTTNAAKGIKAVDYDVWLNSRILVNA